MRKRKELAHNEKEKGICTQKGRERDLHTMRKRNEFAHNEEEKGTAYNEEEKGICTQ
jgi:hypothetical protein